MTTPEITDAEWEAACVSIAYWIEEHLWGPKHDAAKSAERLLERWQAGERTPELYQQMLEVE